MVKHLRISSYIREALPHICMTLQLILLNFLTYEENEYKRRKIRSSLHFGPASYTFQAHWKKEKKIFLIYKEIQKGSVACHIY